MLPLAIWWTSAHLADLLCTGKLANFSIGDQKHHRSYFVQSEPQKERGTPVEAWRVDLYAAIALGSKMSQSSCFREQTLRKMSISVRFCAPPVH